MKGHAFAAKTSRKSTDVPPRHSSAGDKELTFAPPAHGIDFLDRGGAAPVQCVGGSKEWTALHAKLDAKPEAAANAAGIPDRLKAGIESLSGENLSGVRVHVNSPKPSQLNARAYAQGNDIHLAPGQERHLPHEAWHVVQQRQGRVEATSQALGVSINDEGGLEREADLMGAKASRGTAIARTGETGGGCRAMQASASAPSLAPGRASTLVGGTGVVQGYFEENYVTGTWLQSDDLTVATEKGYPNHKLYAKTGKVNAANQKLTAVNSGIELIETGTGAQFWEGSRFSPTRQVELKKIEARNKQNGTSGDDMLLYADCGRSDAVVVGGADRQAVFDKPGGLPKSKAPGSPVSMKTAIMKAWMEHEKAGSLEIVLALLNAQLKETELLTLENEYRLATTKTKTDAIVARYQAKLDEIAESYWAYYNKQSESERDKIDKTLKINRYASPDVGQGYTISSGGASAGKATWNFHWGGVVMTSDDGNDKVVLENYAVGDPTVENKLWTFDIYGTQKKGQTFHERHFGTQQHGKTPTTMMIEKKP